MVSKTGAILSVYQCVMTRSEPTLKCCISVLMSFSVSTFGISGLTILFKKDMKISGVIRSRKSKDRQDYGKQIIKNKKTHDDPHTTTHKFDLKKIEQRERTTNRE